MEPVINETRDKMRKAIEVTQRDLSSIRSGRATPALVEHIMVAAYGGTQVLQLSQMATISVQDAKALVITPYDPSIIEEIAKGIEKANTGLTPVIDGEIIRIAIPMLSEERRFEYLKLAKAKLESGRVMIRQMRGEAMRELKKQADAKTISEDVQRHGERLVQELTDEMIAEIDALGTKKEAELMQV